MILHCWDLFDMCKVLKLSTGPSVLHDIQHRGCQAHMSKSVLRRSYVDIQLVQNAKNLHGKTLQEGCKGLKIDEDEHQGGWCE